MVNRKGIRCGAQGCRSSSGRWRAKQNLESGNYKSGAPPEAGRRFCGVKAAADHDGVSSADGHVVFEDEQDFVDGGEDGEGVVKALVGDFDCGGAQHNAQSNS